MPPPHHYAFAVTAAAGGEGLVEFWPGYPELGSVKWAETFDVPPDSLAELHRLMDEAGVFSRPWARDPRPPIGGRLEWLSAVAGGTPFSVPADVLDAGPAQPVYEFMRHLVPEAVWTGLRTRHEQYRKDYRE